jgi:hypothetical protein
MPYALCPMPYALCPMLHALTLCSLRYALCALPYANWVLSIQLHKQAPWTIQEFPRGLGLYNIFGETPVDNNLDRQPAAG